MDSENTEQKEEGWEKAAMRRMGIRAGVAVGAIAVVVVGLAFAFSFWFGGSAGASDYSAVYMATGDIYYGKLSWFPVPHLTDAWFLQRVGQSDQTQFGVAPLTSAFWGPVNSIDLNPREIVFWTRLRNDSQVVSTIRSKQTASAGGLSLPTIGSPQAASDSSSVQKK